METLLNRVEKEQEIYSSAEHAAIDHINMAHSHLFEEFMGKDINFLLSDLLHIQSKIELFLYNRENH